jgi:pilus assembly protein CpaF
MLPIEERKMSVLSLAEAVRKRMDGHSMLSDEYVNDLCIELVLADKAMLLRPLHDAAFYVRQVFCTLRCELEILQDIADDKDVTEIMVNGPSDIFVERRGKVERSNIRFETRQQLKRVIQRLAAGVGRELNDLNPIVDARLSDGSRINAVHSNIAINGPILTIRRFNKSRMSMDDLIAQGDITKEAADFVKLLVEAGYNIFVSGGTSSGKTTFLNIVSDYIPKDERVIVIEDSAELMIRGHENIVRMEAKSANAQGRGEVTIRDLIRASLRMRPDRIIVGEVRGIEVIDMIAAMSTGHDGSLSTGHANSARGMIRRLETMYLAESGYPIDAVRGQIAEAMEILIHLRRDASGRRRVVEIAEFKAYENSEPVLNRLYEYVGAEGLRPTGEKLIRRDKLQRLLSGEGRDA